MSQVSQVMPAMYVNLSDQSVESDPGVLGAPK